MEAIINEVAFHIRRCAVGALINEVCATPKPGLVDQTNNGAHRDMDLDIFKVSAAAIAPFFEEMAQTGYEWQGGVLELFRQLRSVGLRAEEAMFRATERVNTHKGAIFSLGLIAAAAGYHYRRKGDFQSDVILDLCAKMTTPALEEEFKAIAEKGPRTNGEMIYIRYGIKGIRGEAQSGFRSLRNIALPVMGQLVKDGVDFNAVLIQVLLHLMAEVNDTTVVARGGLEALEYVHRVSRDILDLGGVLTECGRRRLWQLDKIFIEKNISPGGCADLLAAAIMLHFLKNAPDNAEPFLYRFEKDHA